MSTTIDQKVVEMRFDNTRFEKNVSTTISSLEKLKQSLNMTGASKGLEEVEATANKCTMSGMSNAIETVKTKFSALEVMGVTALANITNSAVNAGKRIVSALTIDPITTGFSEYELKMGSIQTMMAATGEDLETVNGYLNELNTYSDKTIYSFSDMTQNIGKFTNAGVSLKDSVAAIQGISNVAAVSGANANEASRAMYNFAQALSSGYVKLIDWKSIELANMGTVEFKQQLIDAAVAAGTLKKSGDGMYKTLEGKTISATKGFNDSLQDQWMTSEVLISTLQKYSDETTDIGKKATQAATEVKTLSQLYDTLKESAQSGWAQTWEIIVGDFEEAKKFMTELSETIGGLIGKSAEARNDMLENWKILGGRTALLDSIRNLIEGIGAVLKPVKEAFNEIFPPMTAERLVGFCEGLKNLTARLKISDDTADKIKRTFKGLFAIIDIVRQVFVGVVNAVGMLLDPVGSLGGGILSITAAIGDLLVGLNNFIKKSNIISTAFYAIGKVVGWVVKAVGNLLSFLGEAFAGGPAQVILNFLDRLSGDVANAFDGMGESIKNSSFYKILSTICDVIKKVAKTIIDVLGDALETVFGALGSGNFADFIDTLVGGGLGVVIGKLIWDLSERIKNVTDFVGAIGDILDEVAGAFKAFQNAINAQALETIASAILKLAIALIALSLINKDKLANGLAVVTVLIAELMTAMHIMGKAGKVKSLALVGIANALLLMVIPLVILGKMKWETLKQGVIGMTTVLGIVIGAIAILSKIKNKGVLKHISVLTSIAFALLFLSLPLAIIGNMEWLTIGRGLLGMTGVLTLVVGTMSVLQLVKNKGTLKQINLLHNIALALILLAIPMRLVGNMEWAEWGKGLLGITALLALMVGVLSILQLIKNKGVVKQITLLYHVALTLILLAIPMRVIGAMSWAEWGKGLLGITALLVLMAGTLAILSQIKVKGVIKNITMLLAICGSLAILAASMRLLGDMETESMKQGLLGVAALMGGLVVVMECMAMISNRYGPTTMTNAATTVILMSAALMILVLSLKKLADLETNKMWQAIAGLAAIMAGLTIVLAGLAAISSTYTSGILTGVGAIIAMSIAVVLLSGSLAVLAAIPILAIVKALGALLAAFLILGAAGYLLAEVSPIILALGASLLMMGVGLLAAGTGAILFGTGLTLIAAGLSALAISIAALLKALASATSAITDITAALVVGIVIGLGQGLLALLKVVADAIPILGEIINNLVLTICDILMKCVPVLVDVVLQLVQSILDALVSFIGPAVDAVLEFVLAVIDSLNSYIGPIIDRIFQFVIEVIDAIAANLKPLAESIGNLIFSLFEAILSILSLMDTSGLAKALLNVGIMLEICLGLAALGVTAPLAMAGVVAFGAIVMRLVAVLAILGGIAQIPGLNWLITEGGNFLQTIGTAIGKFIGGILGGIAAGAAASLPSIGTSLSGFMNNLKDFIEGAKGIDDAALTGIENLAKMILIITGTAILEALLSGLLGGVLIGKFVADLSLLGVGLKNFSDTMAGVSQENINVGAEALTTLSNVAASLPKSGGIIQLVTGEHDLTKFAVQLPMLGYGLKSFSDAVIGIDAASVTAATTALTSLASMSSVIPQMGGLLGAITGNDEFQMSTWAVQLPLLGVGLKGFANAVSGINAEAVTAAANAAKSLAEMTSVIPNTGGIVAWFAGDTCIAKFSGDLVTLGYALKAFSVATVGISPDSVMAAANAAKSLAEMTSYLPNQGGIAAWFAGESSVSKFASELPKLGNGLKGFSTAVAGVNPETVTAAASAAKSLAEMTASIPKEGGIKAWFTGESSVSKFADKLPTLGAGLSGFSKSVAGINPDNITAAANAAKALAEMTDTVPKNTDKIVKFGENLSSFGGHLSSYFSKTAGVSADAASTMGTIVDACNKFASIDSGALENGASAIKKLVKAIKETSGVSADATAGFVTSLKKLGEVSVDAIVKSFDKLAGKMEKVGKEAVKALAKGLSDNTNTATKAAKQLVTDCADAVSKKASSFETAGKNLVKGFANGISINTYLATAKAKAMAKAAAEAAKDALDINSPSKVFREIGSSVPEGFAQGVGKFGNVITASVQDMSGVAVDGVRDSLARVADIINSDSYTEPTIRPVLDLSDVEYGVGRLNSMLGGSASVGVMANIGAINSGMTRRSQNGNFNDVVKSVDKLGDKLDNVGNTTYIIDGVTYDDGSAVAGAVETLIHATKVDRRT